RQPEGLALDERGELEARQALEDDARALGRHQTFAEPSPGAHGMEIGDPWILLRGISLHCDSEVVAARERSDELERLAPAHRERPHRAWKENAVSVRKKRERPICRGLVRMCVHRQAKVSRKAGGSRREGRWEVLAGPRFFHEPRRRNRPCLSR